MRGNKRFLTGIIVTGMVSGLLTGCNGEMQTAERKNIKIGVRL